ncbi:MAG: dienelactone hydrolase family protein [Novosphingobium sp.]
MRRRDFVAMAAAAPLVACAGTGGKDAGQLVESSVTVPTSDGAADAFWVHPAKGRYPGIVLWPDIAGLRDAKMAMARQLAASGFAVLAVNQYYRSARAPVLASFAEWRMPEGRARIAPMAALLTPEAVARDAAAFAAWLDAQAAVDTARAIGTQGYCMGGPFAMRTAAASSRVGAVASFHGGGLVTDKPDSPHLTFGSTRASYLIAVARNDDARASADKDVLRAAAQAAGRPVEIEVYDADHGWCVPDSPVYAPAEAERAFARLLALYADL